MHELEQGQRFLSRGHDARRQLDRVQPLRAFLKHIGDFVDHVEYLSAVRSDPVSAGSRRLLNESHKRVVR
jgi:hypothetical protein